MEGNEKEITLRDVVEAINKLGETLGEKLDETFKSYFGEEGTITKKLEGGFKDLKQELKGVRGSINRLRGEITELALFDMFVEYLKENKENIVKATIMRNQNGVDGIVETDTTIYLVEAKTYLNDKQLENAINQINRTYNNIKKTQKKVKGIIASRFVGYNKTPKNIKIPIEIFTYNFNTEKFETRSLT